MSRKLHFHLIGSLCLTASNEHNLPSGNIGLGTCPDCWSNPLRLRMTFMAGPW